MATKTTSLSIILLFTALTTLILLFQFQSLNHPLFAHFSTSSSIQAPTILSKLRDSVTFLPLKDLRFANSPTTGHTWFMSSLDDTQPPDQPQHLYFPSNSSKNRVLCLSARHRSDGAQNLYALAYPNALPRNATLLDGLTVISDTYYDYTNLWHGLAAIVPFVAWHEKNGCVKPERWVLFHWGELRVEMGNWVKSLAEASTGNEVRIEDFEAYDRSGSACFERAVVFRHNEGGIDRVRREEVFDMIRCKVRKYCHIAEKNVDDMKKIRLTLFFRVGGRAFKNETAVAQVFEEECRKVDGCVAKTAKPNNLTFCDQVKLMTETDILVTAHGAQLTNMLFMDKNSSVLEFYPKGWLEFAGVGQYVYKWMADWSGMRHQGQWRDPEGDKCPYEDSASCFTFYKDGKIGHDEAYFATWMADVLKEVKGKKMSESNTQQQIKRNACSCE